MLSKLSLFGQSILGYLPTTLIKNLLNKKEPLTSCFLPIDFSMNTVVLYADISHFIQFSVNYSNRARLNPEFLQFCLNRYLEQLISIIATNGGDIVKFAGDAIIAIWPGEDEEIKNEKHFLTKVSHRAVQCALDIQNKLQNKEIANGKSFNIKIGIGIGECKIVVLGGLLRRYEYLCAGQAVYQACEGEKKAREVGNIIVSEEVYQYVSKYFTFEALKTDNNKNKFYNVIVTSKNVRYRIASRANANLIRQKLNTNDIVKKTEILRLFIPVAIQLYLFTQNEKWSKEIRIITIMFIKLGFNFSKFANKDQDKYEYLQEIIYIIQQCIYSTKGSLNKFLMDDKGSVVLLAWGLPPFSSETDAINCVISGMKISKSLAERGCENQIGIATGLCYSGTCGTSGNRREYSVIGEKVNFAASLMEIASDVNISKYGWKIVLDDITRAAIQKRIKCEFWKQAKVKGYTKEMDLFIPKMKEEGIGIKNSTNPFPCIRTWLFNSVDKDECSWNKNDEKDVKGVKENFGYLEEIEKMSNKMDQTKLYDISMFMIGHQNKIKKCLTFILDNLAKAKKNVMIQIAGFIGTGKSLFIRNILSELLDQNNKLKNHYYKGKNKFIFFSLFKEDDSLNQFSRLYCILKEIYIILKKKNEIDSLLKKHLIENEKIVEDILQLKSEPHNICFLLKKIPPLPEEIYSFFYSLLESYKNILPDNLPLILIIEDSHLMDEASSRVISCILDSPPSNIIVISAYRIPLFKDPVKCPFFEKESKIMTINLKPFFSTKKIYKLLKHYIEVYEKIKISSITSSLLIFFREKSFKGIPLFLISLFHCLFSSKLISINSSNVVFESQKLTRMMKNNDYTELNYPIIFEKIIGKVIDNLPTKEVISLKLSSIIGDIFDNKKLKQLIKLTTSFSLTNVELYEMLKTFEEKNIIEILYDLDPENKFLVCKFSIPFLREVLYARTLLEQRSQCHSLLSKMLKPEGTPNYLSKEQEITVLEKHLKNGEMSIYKEIEVPPGLEDKDINNSVNFHSLKFLIVKKICNKLAQCKTDKNLLIKGGKVSKKSDGKITWEDRYFALTSKEIAYYYTEKDYIEGTSPLGLFYLDKLISVKKLSDYEIGNKTNIFTLAVDCWIKKDQTRNNRVYYLSVDSKEELFDWIISLKVLKLKTMYESYCSKFGFTRFPLYDTRKNEKYFKNKKINFHLDLKSENLFSNPYYCYGSLSITKISPLKKCRRLSLFSSPISSNPKEVDASSVNIKFISSLIKYTMCFFLSNIQIKIFPKKENENKERLFDIIVPSFLIKIASSSKEELRNKSLAFTSHNEIHQDEGKRKTKSSLLSGIDCKNMTHFLNEDDVGSFNDKLEEKVDQEDYLKYVLYIDKEGNEKGEDYKEKDSVPGMEVGKNNSSSDFEEEDEYAGIKAKQLVKDKNEKKPPLISINTITEEKSNESNVASTKSHFRRKHNDSLDSIEKKTCKDLKSTKSNRTSESEETNKNCGEEEVKFIVEDIKKEAKPITEKKKVDFKKPPPSRNKKRTPIKQDISEKTDQKQLDFGELLRSYSIKNKKLNNQINDEKDQSTYTPQNNQFSLGSYQSLEKINGSMPEKKTKFPERRQEEIIVNHEKDEDLFSLKNDHVPCQTHKNPSFTGQNNFNETLSLKNDVFSLQTPSIDIISKLKALDLSIENEEQYFCPKKTYYSSRKTNSERENDLNSYASISWKISADVYTAKYSYLSSGTVHKKVHKSNFFQHNKNYK